MAYQMSQEAFDEVKAQLQALKSRRKDISKAIGEASAHGDLKENSAYHMARQDQSLNEAKIKELEEKLEQVVVMKEVKRSTGFVSLGSKVKFNNLTSDRIAEYQIVSDLEADIMQNKISNETPLGEALIGAKVGETVEFEAPAGKMKVKVLKIS